jgi:hypothetical protein
MITGFEALNETRAAIAAQSYAEARSAGASIGRVQIDWADLETAPGEYDAQALAELFDDPNLEGMNLVVLVSTLDSEGLTLPSYLQDGVDLRSGLTLAAPEVTDAFAAFLDGSPRNWSSAMSGCFPSPTNRSARSRTSGPPKRMRSPSIPRRWIDGMPRCPKSALPRPSPSAGRTASRTFSKPRVRARISSASTITA